MKAVFLLLFGAVAGAMLWLWLQPVCQGGHVVRNEAECSERFTRDFCRSAFARTGSIAARAGTTYISDADCRQNWPICEPRAPQGFGPRPSHWCLVQAADGSAARIDPQYNDRRQ